MGQRVDNWPAKLADLIELNRNRKFRWGKFDCCIWAAMCVDEITDSIFVDRIKSEYTNKSEAIAFLSRFGSTESAITEYLGETQHLNMTSRGDVVVIDYDRDGYNAAGVFDGQNVIVTGPKGLMRVSRDHIIKSWRV
jgi:hypothetical protein